VPAPGLVVIDEQHRFGVSQRARLRRRGVSAAARTDDGTGTGRRDMLPHLLVLTAPPIPPTLALTVYGDLDLVTPDARPPGPPAVTTSSGQGEGGRRAAYAPVAETIGHGGQAYVICPAIGTSGKSGTRTRAGAKGPTAAESRVRELGRLLAPARVGLCHGQL